MTRGFCPNRKTVPPEKSPSPRMMNGQLTVMTIVVGVVPLICLGTLLYLFYDDAYREKTRALLGEQVLRNALDALDKEGGRVELRSAREGDSVSIAVQDKGHGIPRDVLPRIFEPFFTTKPEGQGTGLGLSICRDILARMGGTIHVDSPPGRGTTFQVRLPLRQNV
jgi:light-regulated signal transduction histidine kinase (bacteriophytochrome)